MKGYNDFHIDKKLVKELKKRNLARKIPLKRDYTTLFLSELLIFFAVWFVFAF